jgi:AcrR family transcriptional regulator
MNDKSRIIDSASFIFSLYGAKTVSMDDVAHYCGMSKRTLYQYFESKEKLVLSLIEYRVSKHEQFIRICPCISPDAVTEMCNFFKHLQNTMDAITPVFYRDLKKHFPAAWQLLVDYRNNVLIPFINLNLNRGITEEVYRAGFNKKVTGWLYLWHLQNALEDTSLSDKDRQQLVDYANSFFLHGVLTPKGLKMVLTCHNK